MNAFPFGGLYLASVIFILLSFEGGWRFGSYRRKQSKLEKKAPAGTVIGSTLGLLTLLLAFTFSLAASRYESRKDIVLQEANAIGTTYLRADFLPAQSREEVREILREYAVLRSGGMSAIMSVEGRAQTANLQARLWAIAAKTPITTDTMGVALFVESLNEMIDLDATRLSANRYQIPDSVWFMLYLLAFFSFFMIGYEYGLANTRNWVILVLLSIAFATVITFIADLDRPQTGFILVSQQPLIDLIQSIGTPGQ